MTENSCIFIILSLCSDARTVARNVKRWEEGGGSSGACCGLGEFTPPLSILGYPLLTTDDFYSIKKTENRSLVPSVVYYYSKRNKRR